MNANTTMPRISNTTPVLFTIATNLTPKMFRAVVLMSVITAMVICELVLFSMLMPMLSPLSSGMITIGMVTSTAHTVSTPANR